VEREPATLKTGFFSILICHPFNPMPMFFLIKDSINTLARVEPYISAVSESRTYTRLTDYQVFEEARFDPEEPEQVKKNLIKKGYREISGTEYYFKVGAILHMQLRINETALYRHLHGGKQLPLLQSVA